MLVSTVTVSNIRLAEMIGATSDKPIGPHILLRSQLGAIRYWSVGTDAFRR